MTLYFVPQSTKYTYSNEASYFDQFSMTKNGLQYLQKNTDKREHWNMTKKYHQQALTVELDRKTDEYD